jgi:deazaflavin-dependent oxidoreductase (nitroreductase family)
MPAPRWLARFNLRVTNRILGPLAKWMPGMGVVIHTGRRSHRRYRTPVMIFPRGDRMIVALTYGRDSEWVRNVLAEGGCELETQGHTIRLTAPRIVHDEERRAVPALHRRILGLLNVSDFLELTRADSQERAAA